ncbi:MAG: histidine phosphatase family protein [Acidobacteria bacterium]|nr:histidine phosphatase family protein [Acidobacteriota bacterium]
MQTLLILRHGKSSWKHPGLADHDRPLNKRGIRDAPRMGRLLRDVDLVPDRIVSSTAVRARATAELVADQLGYRGTVACSRDLYLASAPDIIRVLGNVGGDASRLLVVGHNPGLEELVAALTGGFAGLPTAALAQISLEMDAWSNLAESTPARLVNLWRPRELP